MSKQERGRRGGGGVQKCPTLHDAIKVQPLITYLEYSVAKTTNLQAEYTWMMFLIFPMVLMVIKKHSHTIEVSNNIAYPCIHTWRFVFNVVSEETGAGLHSP